MNYTQSTFGFRFSIQIQHLLKLNGDLLAFRSPLNEIQIQHLLKLNYLSRLGARRYVGDSNTTFVKVKY